jgi:hypothetical protein
MAILSVEGQSKYAGLAFAFDSSHG